MYTQKTIKKPVSCSGIGLHSGNHIEMTFKPASIGAGIWFKRTDLADHPLIKVSYENIVDVTYATTLGRDGVTIHTVEHVLSAVSALGITNLMIEVTGSETPVIDGSASCFVEMLLDAGIETQPDFVRVIRIRQPLEVRGKESIMSVEPYDGSKITYTIDFPNPFIGVQTKTFECSPLAYIEEIAHARTFCLYEEIEYLWKMGLSKGGSLDNAVVFAQERILNGSLRYEDEPVRHKILDLLGDLIFLGHPLVGHIKVYKGGHKLHVKFIGTVLDHPEHWTYLAERDIMAQANEVENDYLDIFHINEAATYQNPLLL
jgi:UDP-3-O-[3-hydroxymyristoyl] N-acetylglucosamine deacetylase